MPVVGPYRTDSFTYAERRSVRSPSPYMVPTPRGPDAISPYRRKAHAMHERATKVADHPPSAPSGSPILGSWKGDRLVAWPVRTRILVTARGPKAVSVAVKPRERYIPGGLGGPTKTRSPAPRSARANMRLAAGKRASVHGISACACNVLKYACTCTDTACIVYAIKRAPERMSGRASGFATHPTNGAACMRVCMHAAMAPCHPSGSPAEAPYPNAYRRTEQIAST